MRSSSRNEMSLHVCENKYIDKNQSVSNQTYYAISIITEDGTTSELSELVVVKDQ